MAEGGRPASELYPPGGAVSSDAALSAEPLLPISKSSVDVLSPTRRTHTSGQPCPTCQEDLKEATGEASIKDPAPCSTTETDNNSQPVRREPAVQVAAQFIPHSGSEYPPEHRTAARTSVHPHSIAEQYTSSHPHKEVVSVTNHSPQAGRGTVERLLPASLPVQRRHSDTVHLVRGGSVPQPPHSETCGSAHHGRDLSTQEAQGQSMQLQHHNAVTTICRGANSGDANPTQQAQGGCVHICMPDPANTSVDVGGEAHHHPQCEETICYGSYVHHGNLEDTFASYCHPQPVPAPAQLLPHLAGMEADCRDQRELPPHPSASLLTLPRLISSVSETGLDTKRMLRCCNLNCSWVSALPPGGRPQLQHQRSGDECYSGTISSSNNRTNPTTKDMGTMTVHRELRNVGVQTSQTGLETALLHPPSHMFPQVCLLEENGNGTSGNQNGTMEGDICEPDGPPKPPVKEVKWDAEGMTWEVYGASLDPEELGLAIQKHLEMQIKETASRASQLSRQDTNTSCHSNNGTCRRKRGGVMGSIRTPACCARSTTAVD